MHARPIAPLNVAEAGVRPPYRALVRPVVAELLEGLFRLRVSETGRVDADLVLTRHTPEGIEHWDFNWNCQDVCLAPTAGRSLREHFDVFMRSLFSDHMYDLAERGLEPDRPFDALPIRIEVPDETLRRF
jgi:hypothetical protein